MQDREVMIEVKDLCKSYGEHLVLDGLSRSFRLWKVYFFAFSEFIRMSGFWFYFL